MKPPLLPSEVLRRVERVSRVHGMTVLGLAGTFALISAGARDVTGAVVGLLVAGAGALEFHGASMLRSRLDGTRWLVASQLYLMGIILAYVAYRITHPDVAWMLHYMTGDAAEPIKEAARQQGLSTEQMLAAAMVGFYLLVAALTVVYQGLMAAYYLRKRRTVAEALAEDPE
jgi:hypothetical protein